MKLYSKVHVLESVFGYGIFCIKQPHGEAGQGNRKSERKGKC